jgi:hypothetical protein
VASQTCVEAEGSRALGLVFPSLGVEPDGLENDAFARTALRRGEPRGAPAGELLLESLAFSSSRTVRGKILGGRTSGAVGSLDCDALPSATSVTTRLSMASQTFPNESLSTRGSRSFVPAGSVAPCSLDSQKRDDLAFVGAAGATPRAPISRRSS